MIAFTRQFARHIFWQAVGGEEINSGIAGRPIQQVGVAAVDVTALAVTSKNAGFAGKAFCLVWRYRFDRSQWGYPVRILSTIGILAEHSISPARLPVLAVLVDALVSGDQDRIAKIHEWLSEGMLCRAANRRRACILAAPECVS